MAISTSSATSPLGGTATGKLSVTGLVSGLDTEQIVQGLTAMYQQRIARIEQRRSSLTAEQTAFKEINTRLMAFKGTLTALARTQNGLFNTRAVVSSDESALKAAASSSAAAGVYQLRIYSLARAHQLASQGFDSATSAITQGTFTLTVGDRVTQITVDASNSTLTGLANSINRSGAGVTASILYDGSGNASQGYRLVLSAKDTGLANSIRLSSTLADSVPGGALKPAFEAVVGNAASATNNTSTANVQSNAGAAYTGTTNNRYTFTVVNGGTVGTDDNLTLSYTDATGTNTGTITVNSGDVDQLMNVAQGVSIKLSAGTLVAGDKFTVKTFVPTVQEAADASVSVGSGDGALVVTSASNRFDSLIPGVSLNVLQADPNRDLTLTISNDTKKMKEGIKEFVDAYNELMKYIDKQNSYNADTKKAGVLLGNRQATSIQDQLRSLVLNVVPGANPRMSHLGALGISVDDKALLVIDDAKLSKVLEGNVAGVSLEDVFKLFALSGSTTDPGIEFITGSIKTRASTEPYRVQITQAAERASLTSTNVLAASTVLTSANNVLQVTVDGVASSTLTLAEGTYSQSALAQLVQAALNNDQALLGRRVSVAAADGKLTVSSERFGAASQVAMTTGTALAALGFYGGESAQGRDVEGSFTVGGIVEPAKGSGQFLVGESTNANTADLQLRVTLTAAQVGAGVQADVAITRGIASQLDNLLSSVFDPTTGRLKSLDDNYKKSMEELDEQTKTQNELMQAKQQSLLKQFRAMEETLSRLQSAGSFLNSQALSLPKSSQ